MITQRSSLTISTRHAHTSARCFSRSFLPSIPCPLAYSFDFIQLLSLSQGQLLVPSLSSQVVRVWKDFALIDSVIRDESRVSLCSCRLTVLSYVWLALQILGNGSVPGLWPPRIGQWHTCSLSTSTWFAVSIHHLPIFSQSLRSDFAWNLWAECWLYWPLLCTGVMIFSSLLSLHF